MLLNLSIWLAVLVVVSYLTRDRHKAPAGVDHPAVLRTQPAYRDSSARSG